jgi:ABC-type amino acid transport system permease subunit
VAGALLPELATHFLGVHAGFNLYNIGFAAGFLGTLITSQLRAFGRATDMIMIWSVEYTASLTVLLLCYFISLIILGTIIEPGAWRKLPQIFRQSGLLVSDFIVNTLWQASFSAPKSKSGIPRIQGQF